MGSFEGKVAVVLGASAEGGTGWAIAEAFASEGAKVVVGARSFEPLKKLANKIGGLAVKCDASKEEDIINLADQTLEKYGKVDIAVNSAGASFMSMIADVTPEILQSNAELNFFGMVYFTKHMAKAMGAREIGNEGSIILITSMSTTHPTIPHFAYAGAKSATNCMVQYAALEYAPQHIKVNSILPGAIMSDMAKAAFSAPGMREAFVKEVPFGRLGEPEDFANATLWLAGPAYVTGLNLQVNGGNHLTRFPFPSELPMGTESFGDGKTLYDREKNGAAK